MAVVAAVMTVQSCDKNDEENNDNGNDGGDCGNENYDDCGGSQWPGCPVRRSRRRCDDAL